MIPPRPPMIVTTSQNVEIRSIPPDSEPNSHSIAKQNSQGHPATSTQLSNTLSAFEPFVEQESIPILEERKRKVHEVFSKSDAAHTSGRITKEQRDAILTHYYGTANEQHVITNINAKIALLRAQHDDDPRMNKTVVLVVVFSLVMLSLFGTLFLSTGGATGAVVIDTNTQYTTGTNLTLQLSDTTRVNITGGAQGIGNAIITLIAGGERYVLFSHEYGVQETPHAALPKSVYEQGENVTFSANFLASAYIISATTQDATLLSSRTLENLPIGEYTIKLIINDSGVLTQEALHFTVVAQGTDPPSETFDTCGTACNVNLTGNATLEIQINGDAIITLRRVELATQANRAPQLTHAIPDTTGTGTIQINLSQYFTDPDGDELIYDVSHQDQATETIQDGILTITGLAGTTTYVAYASDMHELTPSNLFAVTINGVTTSNDSPTTGAMTSENTTVNNTPVENIIDNNSSINITTEINMTTEITLPNTSLQNISLNTSQNSTEFINQTLLNIGEFTNTTNETTNGTIPALDCSGANPNSLLEECLLINSSKYFPDQDIYIENVDRKPVARFTVIGNLLLTGTVIEHSTAQPNPNDFTLGYPDQDLQMITTIWIDSNTGDLHLRGSLVEENANLQPSTGSYTITTKRKVYVAYADTTTGDLHIRGNAIPYRRSLT